MHGNTVSSTYISTMLCLYTLTGLPRIFPRPPLAKREEEKTKESFYLLSGSAAQGHGV